MLVCEDVVRTHAAAARRAREPAPRRMSFRTARTRTTLALAGLVLASACAHVAPRPSEPAFRVLAFFTGKQDQAHISFLGEAVKWFPEQAARNGFSFDTTSDWRRLNDAALARYQVVVFLDTRPEDPAQRAAFQRYMERGGAWMGFHFAGFALGNSVYPANWPWYHDVFLGAGQYASNTWRPTPAILRVEAGVAGRLRSMEGAPKKLGRSRALQICLSVSPRTWHPARRNWRRPHRCFPA